MKMSKLSNQTNSQDPQAVNSRVFVGNLNTFQCSKTDVERMFQRYGRLAGISMHKGYAFVQFTNPFDARNACHGEDGRNILSQILDVNMVAEPKPHQIGRKRQNINKTGNDWDYYYDSYYTSTLFPNTSPRPMKRQRLMGPQQQPSLLQQTRLLSGLPPNQQSSNGKMMLHSPPPNGHPMSLQNGGGMNNGHGYTNGGGIGHLNGGGGSCNGGINGDENQSMLNFINNGAANVQSLSLKVYSNPDTLICGNCRECFAVLTDLLDHKRSYCKLRFTCKCQSTLANVTNKIPSSARLLCAVCKTAFLNPWDLMVHAQAAHMINIYELGAERQGADNTTATIPPVKEVDRSSEPDVIDSAEETVASSQQQNSSTSKEEHESTFQSSEGVGGRGGGGDRNNSNGGVSYDGVNGDKINGKSQSLAEELTLISDIENASSSSPIMSQMEIETNIANNVNKLIDGGLLTSFSCALDSSVGSDDVVARNARACIVGAAVSIERTTALPDLDSDRGSLSVIAAQQMG